MAIPAWTEARLALTGALKLARGDPSGLAYFDASIEGFWHSFRAAVLCYPLYLVLVSLPADAAPAAPDAWRILAIETIHFVIFWVAFPLAALPLVQWLDRDDHFLGFMVAFNWCQVPQSVLCAVVGLAGGSGMLTADATALAGFAAGVVAMIYEWYVSQVALAVSGLRAILIILLDLVLATLLSHIAEALY